MIVDNYTFSVLWGHESQQPIHLVSGLSAFSIATNCHQRIEESVECLWVVLYMDQSQHPLKCHWHDVIPVLLVAQHILLQPQKQSRVIIPGQCIAPRAEPKRTIQKGLLNNPQP